MTKLKERWGIESNTQIIVILLVFSINGSTSAFLSKPLLSLLGISKEAIGWYFYYPLASIIILPVYFVLLPLVAWIFGQFKWFWKFEKKSLKSMGLGFLFKDEKEVN